MAASANPSGNQEGNSNNNSNNGHNSSSNGLKNNNNNHGTGGGGGNPNNNINNGNSVPVGENSFRPRGLKHSPNPGLSLKWTAEEQLILEEGLIKFSLRIEVLENMAAWLDLLANQEGNNSNSNTDYLSFDGPKDNLVSAIGNPNYNSGSSVAVMEKFFRPHGLAHYPDPGLALKWTANEQLILEKGLIKYASESVVHRYTSIALELPDKTARDVALRHRWMTKKENGKRRKDDHNLARKNKDRKEKVSDPSTKSLSHLAARPNVPPYALPMIPIDNDDGISFKAIGGATGQLLEQNAQVFNQISANFTSFQYQENINLFCQTRDNILSILNDLNDMPGIMNQMPPLPVKMNEELANSILPRTSVSMQQ